MRRKNGADRDQVVLSNLGVPERKLVAPEHLLVTPYSLREKGALGHKRASIDQRLPPPGLSGLRSSVTAARPWHSLQTP